MILIDESVTINTFIHFFLGIKTVFNETAFSEKLCQI